MYLRTRHLLFKRGLKVFYFYFYFRILSSENYDVNCLSDIMENNVRPIHYKKLHFFQLVTVYLSRDLQSPVHEMQDEILQRVPSISNWSELEVMSVNEHDDVSSQNTEYHYRTSFYLLIINIEEDLSEVIENLKERGSFNARANFLVYLNVPSNQEYYAEKILELLYDHLIIYCGVLINENSVISFYEMSFVTKAPNVCLSNRTVFVKDQCVNG